MDSDTHVSLCVSSVCVFILIHVSLCVSSVCTFRYTCEPVREQCVYVNYDTHSMSLCGKPTGQQSD